jgi:hypothetical protein
LEGESKLKLEVEGCRRINPNQRVFCINANHKNEETGEDEPLQR